MPSLTGKMGMKQFFIRLPGLSMAIPFGLTMEAKKDHDISFIDLKGNINIETKKYLLKLKIRDIGEFNRRNMEELLQKPDLK